MARYWKDFGYTILNSMARVHSHPRILLDLIEFFYCWTFLYKIYFDLRFLDIFHQIKELDQGAAADDQGGEYGHKRRKPRVPNLQILHFHSLPRLDIDLTSLQGNINHFLLRLPSFESFQPTLQKWAPEHSIWSDWFLDFCTLRIYTHCYSKLLLDNIRNIFKGSQYVSNCILRCAWSLAGQLKVGSKSDFIQFGYSSP